MLCLSRKPGQVIQLQHRSTGEIITVTVVRIGSNTVQLGFEADKMWQILRTELLTTPEEPT